MKNEAHGAWAGVLSGGHNKAEPDVAVIAGGEYNTIFTGAHGTFFCFVFGGFAYGGTMNMWCILHLIKEETAFPVVGEVVLVVCGDPVFDNTLNFASLPRTGAVISGGSYNLVDSTYGIVVGGKEQNITSIATFGVITGGLSNYVNGSYAVVAGGQSNSISGSNSVISGGQYNYATGRDSVVSGGVSNSATGDATVISGGSGNRAEADQAFVGGGLSQVLTSPANYGVLVRLLDWSLDFCHIHIAIPNVRK